jgi:hypothetical protein
MTRKHLSRLQPTSRLCSSLLVAATTLALGACSSGGDEDSGNALEDGTLAAFVATRASDFSSGRVDRLVVAGDSFVVDANYPATISDLRVGTIDGDLIEVARFNTSTLARYTADDTSAPVWEFSVNSDETDANPIDVIFDEAGFGYVTRYGTDELWVIDPSVAADAEADFLDTTFDLGAYDDDAPNMTDAVIVNDQLFVLMERLANGFEPSQAGYVAVFDLMTGLEVDTGQGEDGLFGIKLDTVNPTSLQYNEDSDLLFVVGRGNAFLNPDVPGDPYSGGLESIDPVSFENTLVVDDGTEEENVGFFTDALVVSANKAYLVTPTAFPNNTVLIANLGDGTVNPSPVAGLEDQPVSMITQDATGRIWVGIGGNEPGFFFLDPETDELSAEMVRTDLVPIDLAFPSN